MLLSVRGVGVWPMIGGSAAGHGGQDCILDCGKMPRWGKEIPIHPDDLRSPNTRTLEKHSRQKFS